MARRSDPAQTRLWSDRLKRFGDSSKTVSDFCRSEGVSVSAFHNWNRHSKDHAPSTPNDSLAAAPFLPVRLADAAAASPTAGAPNARSSAGWVGQQGQGVVGTDSGETSGRLPIFLRDTKPLRNVWHHGVRFCARCDLLKQDGRSRPISLRAGAHRYANHLRTWQRCRVELGPNLGATATGASRALTSPYVL